MRLFTAQLPGLGELAERDNGCDGALLYCFAIGLAFVSRWLGLAVYVAVAVIWLVPDRRVERHLTTGSIEPIE